MVHLFPTKWSRPISRVHGLLEPCYKVQLMCHGSTLTILARDSVHVIPWPRLSASFHFASGSPDDPTYFDRSLLHHSSSSWTFRGIKTDLRVRAFKSLRRLGRRRCMEKTDLRVRAFKSLRRLGRRRCMEKTDLRVRAFKSLRRLGRRRCMESGKPKDGAKEEVLEGIEPPFLGGPVFEASEEAGSSQNRVY